MTAFDALVLTVVVEVLVVLLSVWALRGRLPPRTVLDAFLLNVLTHPVAHLAYRTLGGGRPAFVLIEVGVVVVEAVGYRWVTGLSWGRAWGVSLVANGVTIAISLVA